MSVPEAIIVPEPSILSVHLAPGSTNAVQALIVTAPDPLSVITGGTLSVTSTILLSVTVLRLESVTL